MDTSHQHAGFLVLLALVTIAFFWVLLPFYGAVFWAVILAIIFNPMHRALERRMGGRRNLAAMLSVLVCIVIAIIPMIVVVTSLVAEGTRLVQRIQENPIDLAGLQGQVQAALPARLGPWFEGIDFNELRERLSSAFVEGSQIVAGQALNIGQNTLKFFVSAGIMLYVLFFLFRDGPAIGRNIRSAMPLSKNYSDQLLSRFATVVRATVKGNVIIAAIQGTIGGVAFWLLGIEAALLWGALMAFLSLLPAVGAALVWVPAAAWLLMTGAYAKGIILIAVGVAVIGLVDNLLRPPLVGKDTRLPDYVVLVSTIGGMSIFGINGFVIGPLIAALFMSGWALYRDEQQRGGPAGQDRAGG
jgi:predicted PurR-regulated permease PerM